MGGGGGWNRSQRMQDIHVMLLLPGTSVGSWDNSSGKYAWCLGLGQVGVVGADWGRSAGSKVAGGKGEVGRRVSPSITGVSDTARSVE